MFTITNYLQQNVLNDSITLKKVPHDRTKQKYRITIIGRPLSE